MLFEVAGATEEAPERPAIVPTMQHRTWCHLFMSNRPNSRKPTNRIFDFNVAYSSR